MLIAYATRGGSTRGVAERLADRLRAGGAQVDLRDAGEAGGVGGYDAVVFGSPCYNTSWLPEGEEFVRGNLGELAGRPVWLFSVASFGDRKRIIGPLMRREPKDIDEILGAVHPREYRVFAGVIERRQWSLPGRVLFRAFGGRFGDSRDWADIDAWGDDIARSLPPPAQP